MSGTPVVIVRPVTGDDSKTVKIFSDPRNRLCTCVSANHLAEFYTLTHTYAGTLSGILKHFESLVGDDKKQRSVIANHSSVLDFCGSLDIRDKKKRKKLHNANDTRKYKSRDSKAKLRKRKDDQELSDSDSESEVERR